MNISVDRLIWNKLHIKRNDTLPFTGWNKNATRTTLAEIMSEAGYKVGAEIGVRHGTYSLILAKTIPNLKLKCIDPYAPYRGRRPSQERQDLIFAHAKKILEPYDVEFLRMTSMDAVKLIPDGSLDFVYIDAMHEFDPVMMDIISWAPKVRVGGIVSGHDYAQGYQVGVVRAVDAYTYSHNINNWYIVHGEGNPSWFWVKK